MSPHPDRRRALRALAVLAAPLGLTAWLACGPGIPEPASGPGTGTKATAPAATDAPDAAGVLLVELAGGRVALRARDVPRSQVLAALAAEAGFELQGGPAAPQSVRLDMSDAALTETLAALLHDVPFRIEFEPAARGTGSSRLARVVLEGPQSADPHPARVHARRLAPAPSQAAPSSESAATGGGLTDAAVAAGLDDRDPAIRAHAAAHLMPKQAGLRQLMALVTEDADPEVRSAAASQLGLAQSGLAAGALLLALEDPDPRVVVSALDSLEFVGDATLIAEIEPLLFHPDEAVREAAAGTIGSLL